MGRRRGGGGVQAKERERERAEGRAAQAEAALAEAKVRGASEAEKGGALSTALASQRKVSDRTRALFSWKNKKNELMHACVRA